MPWVYIVECTDGSFYVGSARSLEVRISEHASGIGAEHVRRHGFKRLAFAQELENIGEAYAMEKRIQGWSRAKRQAIIDGEFSLLPSLSRSARERRKGFPEG